MVGEYDTGRSMVGLGCGWGIGYRQKQGRLGCGWGIWYGQEQGRIKVPAGKSRVAFFEVVFFTCFTRVSSACFYKQLCSRVLREFQSTCIKVVIFTRFTRGLNACFFILLFSCVLHVFRNTYLVWSYFHVFYTYYKTHVAIMVIFTYFMRVPSRVFCSEFFHVFSTTSHIQLGLQFRLLFKLIFYLKIIYQNFYLCQQIYYKSRHRESYLKTCLNMGRSE